MKNISTKWLSRIVPVICIVFAASAFAETFWAHGINKRVDVAYGEDPQQIMDVFMHGARVGPLTSPNPDMDTWWWLDQWRQEFSNQPTHTLSRAGLDCIQHQLSSGTSYRTACGG